MFDFPPPMTEPNRQKTCENGENKSLQFAACAMPGWRPFQQDAHNCILDYWPEVSFFAVYDGHVSAQVSLYLAHYFPDYLKQRNVLLAGPENITAELRNAFVDFDATLREEETVEKMYAIPDLSIPTGSILVDLGETWMGETEQEEAAVAQGDEEEPGEHHNLDPDFPPDEFGGIREGHLTGSTACVAIVFKERIVVANAGDSRAVLCRAGKALDLSTDHKPEVEAEKNRIEAAGGTVSENGRLNGGLHRSRGFGHHRHKQNMEINLQDQMLTALPDVTTTPRDGARDEFLVIASGDVWSRLSSQELCNFVADRIGQKGLQEIVEEICDHCCSNELVQPDGYNFGPGCENETVILIDLKKDQRPAIKEGKKETEAGTKEKEAKKGTGTSGVKKNGKE